MNDGWFFGVLFYLVASVLIVGSMPSYLYTGTSYNEETEEKIRATIDSGSATVDASEQLGFMQKILTFLFVSWKIDAIPLFVGLLITILNLFSVTIIVIWIYDKVRGIGS